MNLILKENKKQMPLRITNGICYAARSGGSGSKNYQSGYALYGNFFHHIFTVAGKLRFPLSQP